MSRFGCKWFYTCFVTLRDSKLGGCWLLIQVLGVTVGNFLNEKFCFIMLVQHSLLAFTVAAVVEKDMKEE